MYKRTVPGKGKSSVYGRSDGSGDSLQRLKRLDIYARPNQEFQRGTFHGGVVSFFLVVLVSVLVWRELRFSMETETVSSLFVNSTIDSRVNVTFDVSFPRIPCAFISLDAEDASGITQSGVVDDVRRTRLDEEGRSLDEGEKQSMGNTLKAAIAKEKESESNDSKNEEGKGVESDDSNKCNCYGAGSDGECCKTCADVRAAYRRKGWKFSTTGIPKCAGENNEDSAVPFGERVDGLEGCRLAGSLQVTKTEGNFHFAPGRRLHRHLSSMSFMEHIQVALEKFNTTHTIHSLSFGDQPSPEQVGNGYPSASTSVLAGHQKVVQDTHAMHQYYLQLVPTTYRLLDGTRVYGSQYSATEHLRHVDAGLGKGLPGVYMYYTVSPVQALMEQRRRGYLSFLTSVCGVVGGVYTILGLVNTGISGLARTGGGRRRDN